MHVSFSQVFQCLAWTPSPPPTPSRLHTEGKQRLSLPRSLLRLQQLLWCPSQSQCAGGIYTVNEWLQGRPFIIKIAWSSWKNNPNGSETLEKRLRFTHKEVQINTTLTHSSGWQKSRSLTYHLLGNRVGWRTDPGLMHRWWKLKLVQSLREVCQDSWQYT